ncbi:MAG: Protein translocase subunit SecA [candidate division TM6 bacterium GW2011_GWE2_42_60]|nr:MAG: Protein translocase subunit SecA [candidate division TM6 bacterium GW2011_GWE2_42_60]HBY05831.1 preprotein translocase subunit SecA [Candidatus Dependentiae bacterium]
MIAGLIAKLLGTQNERTLKRIKPLVQMINDFEPAMKSLSEIEMAAKTNEFRAQISKGRSLDDILPEAYALVREAARRKLGERHYDVQLIGGIALHQGRIAEMKTGEGKTLVATLPLYLNALSGKGAHLVTVNDYLARRDAQWMAPVFEMLGLTVGILQNSTPDSDRKEIYQRDILYATNNELGFDYLRDNMKFRLSDYVQRELNFAIVDEVDSILIDEARTPLIISGATDESSRLYVETDLIIKRLQKTTDYDVDEKDRHVTLTEVGIDKVEEAFSIKNLFAIENIKLLHHVNQALRAHALFRRDIDYIVTEDQVLIVDEFTGRVLSGRRYSDGLHQALEAKEGAPVQEESQTLASITLQNYFRLYKKLAGMTGTASTEAEEFHRIYKLEVLSIPTNRPCIRIDQPDLIFLGRKGKYNAIITDVKERHKKGQPVLIGTIAVETSEYLGTLLSAAGIPHSVLNAKQHAREADIVAHAGEPGSVTIATNMAGRGTDIKLTDESRVAGGLYILGTERHESRRIDNQLRGRAGRQGDPGESRFYISLEDELIRIFAGDTIQRRMKMVGMTEDEVIESKFISKNIERSQEMVERRNFDIRKNVLEYDDVLNQQRIVIYSYRRSVLEGAEEIAALVRDLITECVADIVNAYTVKRTVTLENYQGILLAVAQLINVPVDELLKQPFNKGNSEILKKDIIDYLLLRYEYYLDTAKLATLADDKVIREALLNDAQKWLLLESIDQAWKQHMVNLEGLKEGIGLRGWGNKNPLIEYKREAYDLFTDMMRSIRSEIVHHIFHLDLDQFNRAAIETRRVRELEEIKMAGTDDAATDDEEQMSRADRRKKKRR